MSGLGGKVGAWKLNWSSVPRGPAGQVYVEVSSEDPAAPAELRKGRQLEVRWRRDADGIWIELPYGVFGYDIQGEPGSAEEGTHSYRVARRALGGGEWASLAFVRAGEESVAAAAGGKKKGARVRAQMPGKVIRVLVAPGDHVERDQPLAVLEAMKMENEIRAAQGGTVTKVHVTEGQAVESGADLLVIE